MLSERADFHWTDSVQWTYNGSNSQKWTFAYLGSGIYKAINLNANRAMDVTGGSTADGTNLQIWDYIAHTSEQWTILPTGDGFFKLTAVHSGKVADVWGLSTADGAAIKQGPWNGGNNQQWWITTAP